MCASLKKPGISHLPIRWDITSHLPLLFSERRIQKDSCKPLLRDIISNTFTVWEDNSYDQWYGNKLFPSIQVCLYLQQHFVLSKLARELKMVTKHTQEVPSSSIVHPLWPLMHHKERLNWKIKLLYEVIHISINKIEHFFFSEAKNKELTVCVRALWQISGFFHPLVSFTKSLSAYPLTLLLYIVSFIMFALNEISWLLINITTFFYINEILINVLHAHSMH